MAPDPDRDVEDDNAPVEAGAPSQLEIKNALYARCASHKEDGKIFNQKELLSFGIVPKDDVEQLMVCTKQLTKDGLFKLMAKDKVAHWRVIKKADAAKFKLFTTDEALVYSYVESAGRQGIWSRLLRARTGLHLATMNRAIKTLENKEVIKSIKSIKFPTRKTFILSSLQPSDDVTGGPFYTDGILDTEFIQHISKWAERYVIARSWYFPPREGSGSKSAGKRKLHSELEKAQMEEQRADEFKLGPGRDRSDRMLPLPPGFKDYPTLEEITRETNASELSNVQLKQSEMKQLLDVLRWDSRIDVLSPPGEKNPAYRATKTVAIQANGLTEAPCGKCPVFEFCEDGGPVNARSCEYFQDWLAF